MAERYPEAELVLDDELVYDESPRRSSLLRRDDRHDEIVREGEVLAGKYRVERIPGRNGLGVVVQVRHLELAQEVTLKFLVPEACAYPEFVQRFVREARAAVKIQGEHVARVTDVGRLESGAPYMVREFLRGPDLGEVTRVRGPLPIAEAVDYVIQACEGVAEGHALGVVHRNIRPTTLIVTRRSDGSPLVKVFDFAASESLHVDPFTERAVSLVGTSAIMASLPYLAPEQIRDPHDVDFRADIYSLGAILFELLVGAPLYSADSAPALLAMVAADAAPAVRTLRSDVPGELDHIVLRCLAKNRAIRYSSAAELVLALRDFASPETGSSVDRVVRLGKRTAPIPGLTAAKTSSSLPPLNGTDDALPLSRGPSGTVPIHTSDRVNVQSPPPPRIMVHDDVTAIAPYGAPSASSASFAQARNRGALPAPASQPPAAPIPLVQVQQPVVVQQPSIPQGPGYTLPPPVVQPSLVQPPLAQSPLAQPPLAQPSPSAPQPAGPGYILPPPPRMRSSGPPPLRPDAAPQQQQPAAAPAAGGTPLPSMAPRHSMSGLSRSWAVPDEPPSPPLLNKRRMIAAGAVAACAIIGGVIALRSAPRPAPVAAAPPPPARVEPPPAPAPPPVDPAVAAAAASASAAVLAAAAAPPAPVAAAPAPVAAAPAPVAATPAPVAAAMMAPRPVNRPPAPRPAAPRPTEAKAPAATEKVASTRPASLFDDPN